MGKNIVELDKPQITIWRMRFACWITKASKNTLIIRNTYRFSTATMVTRTRLKCEIVRKYAFLSLQLMFEKYFSSHQHVAIYARDARRNKFTSSDPVR